ncbi:hypothetical protein [Pseudoduganella sp.]|uniref:hypothetical protein n=1 Tax=Pseudoduganella sp. TaxID=1880898 RepID=UPI0035B2F07E
MNTLLWILAALATITIVWAVATPYRPATAQVFPDHTEDFFRDPANFVGVPIERIFAQVGRPLDYDDWDWGRLVYDWRTARSRIRLVTRGGYAICVQFLDPADKSRFGTELETVWENKESLP